MSRWTRFQSVAAAITALYACTALVALAAVTPRTARGNPAAAAKGNAAAGKAIFAVKCVLCHKVDGSGGMKLTGNPTPNWKDPKTWADPKRTDDYLRDCITNGKTKSGMVAWVKTGQVKASDVDNLIAYIHTLGPKK
jgi:mono/diheme cytochrome c family protein